MYLCCKCLTQGRIQDFKLGGAQLEKLRRVEGGAKIFGVFRVKKSRFYAKKIIFFPIAEAGAKIFGVFRVKNHDLTPKNHIFFNFRGGARRVHPPGSAPEFKNVIDNARHIQCNVTHSIIRI